jgi:sec-independent protein translocase protein TatA
MGWDAPWHWVVLAIIVIALFGYKKLPDAARSLGRSLRIFKTEIKGMNQDDAAREQKAIETSGPTPSEPAAGPEAPPPASSEIPATTAKQEPAGSE